MRSILDNPDRPFPGPLSPTVPAIRTLYRRAKRQVWDPALDVPWSEFDASRYTEEQLYAGRVYYSGRGWSEYGAISESPVLQLRYDLDGLEPDLSLFWAVRTEEEARHAEVSARFAELLGGYFPEMPSRPGESDASGEALAPAPQTEDGATRKPYLGTRARALEPDLPVEATIAGLVCVAETVVYDVFREMVRVLRDPVAKAIFSLIVRDEVRHCLFGWEYLRHRRPQMTAATREACAGAMNTMIQDIELGGYRSAWLAPGRDPEMERVDRVVFEAGLGGAVPEWEGPILVKAIRSVRRRAGELGIELAVFHHPVLGEI